MRQHTSITFIAFRVYDESMNLSVLRLRSLWKCNTEEKRKHNMQANSEEEKIGEIIFYYI